jgi:hypothetical protein
MGKFISTRKKKRWRVGPPTKEATWRRVYKIEAHTRQNAKCPYCTGKMLLVTNTAEHITPVSRGGQTRPDNIDAACAFCNRQKGSLTKVEFLRVITEPDYQNDPWKVYLAGVNMRLMRATEDACRRLASIIQPREQSGVNEPNRRTFRG